MSMDPYQQGRRAAMLRQPMDYCPFPKGSAGRGKWFHGWLDQHFAMKYESDNYVAYRVWPRPMK